VATVLVASVDPMVTTVFADDANDANDMPLSCQISTHHTQQAHVTYRNGVNVSCMPEWSAGADAKIY